MVAEALEEQKVPLKRIEIKGDGHEAPYGNQSWWPDALKFVTGEDFALTAAAR